MSGESATGALQVCVRVRPLFDKEKNDGHRVCVHYDEPTRQVVLTAVDKTTLVQLHGHTARGYSFDRYYPTNSSSDDIYDDTIRTLVDNCYKGYNATVLAYGQTGSGKTHTMAGGVGIHGVPEEGIIPKVIDQVFNLADQHARRAKPGEGTEIYVSALEIYNEELVDLSPQKQDTKLKIQERTTSQGRNSTEVVGLVEERVHNVSELLEFFDACMQQRSTGCTKLNERSSRSHAIFTISIHRTSITLHNELDDNFKAKISSEVVCSKLHLVDLAGSERVKRSGVSGQQLKEATHINGGLLALGNVIVALAKLSENQKKGHVPYRDSKLTRLLQDSLGGNSLTALITCISSSEKDFEETSNTLKYANRACRIKNTPLPNKYTVLEEDLLPVAPDSKGSRSCSISQLTDLLKRHGNLKEIRAQRAKEKAEREAKRSYLLQRVRGGEMKTPGYQRLRAHEYDRLRKERANGRSGFGKNETISGDSLTSFGRKRTPLDHSTRSDRGQRPASASTQRPLPAPLIRPRTAVNRGRSRIPNRSTPSPTSTTAGSHSDQQSGAAADFESWLDMQGVTASCDSNTVIPAYTENEKDKKTEEVASDAEQPLSLVVSNSEDSGIMKETEGTDAGTPGTWGEDSLEWVNQQTDSESLDLSKDKERVASLDPDSIIQSQSTDSIKVEWSECEDQPSLSSESTEPDALNKPELYNTVDELLSEQPRLLARFKINQKDIISVFKSCSEEDYKDVMSLLPANTPLPASDRMTYLLARLETQTSLSLDEAISRVSAGKSNMNTEIGPAVGCLMATYGTNMINSCIFDFEDPVDLLGVDERIELWGLQIPHNSARPALEEIQKQLEITADSDIAVSSPSCSMDQDSAMDCETIVWSSIDRLNMSVGLLYALCSHAVQRDIRCGFCVPRPQLLRRWSQAGVSIKEINTSKTLIYPKHAHDFEYYKSSTVAYFMVEEVQNELSKKLATV